MADVNILSEWRELRERAEASLGVLYSGLSDISLIRPLAEIPKPQELRQVAMEKLNANWASCLKCSRHRGRKAVLTGSGSLISPLVVLLDSPDEDEDRRGIPAQMESGELLEKMLRAVGFDLQSVFITHTLKCFAPSSIRIEPTEIDTCAPYFAEQIAILQPRWILALGSVAAQTLLRTDADLAHLRGQWGTYNDIPVLSSWSPAQLLAQPEKKREAWNDLKLLIARRANEDQ